MSQEDVMAEINPAALPLSVLHVQVEADRKRRSEEHKKEVRERGLNQRTLAERGGRGPLNLYADGDSWFEYPLATDTIDWIGREGTPRPAINNQAHHGDSAVERLGLAKRQRLIANLDPAHGAYDALLFSAGGNDIAGDQFILWVLKYIAGTDPAHGVDRQRLASIFGVIKGAYEDLIAIRDAYEKDCVVFLHGYDFALPTGKGACPGIGPWLKPSLDFQGWTDATLAAGIVKEVLSAFDKILRQIAQQHKNVIYVPTQGTLSAGDWANELHPTRDGFEKIAQVFLRTMRARFPGRI
jgi:hypothetical protein